MQNINHIKKIIGQKHQVQEETKTTKKIVSESEYTTNGENLILIKGIEYCELILNEETTHSIKIKSLTKVLIKSKNYTIDENYSEILIERGACVELEFFEDGWYILSSDGLKLV